MPSVKRVKRRLLRQAVLENLAFIEGQTLSRRRRSPFGRAGAVGLATGVLLLALVAVWQLPRRPLASAAAPAATLSQAATLPLPPPASPADQPASAVEAAARRFPPPQRLERGVFPLAVRRVVIDAGHGGTNRGTEAPGGLTEKEITLDLARRLEALLGENGYEVVLTRDGDRDVTLEERGRLANARGGDIFVSIHVNWIPDRATRGVETYFLGATDDPFLTQLAASENRDSGYSLSDLRRLLDGIYADLRQAESRRLAEAVQGELYTYLHELDAGVRDRGVKTAPFVVLIATDMPAILAEVSCLSNAEEARLLGEASYRQYIALALFAGIRSYTLELGAQPAGG